MRGLIREFPKEFYVKGFQWRVRWRRKLYHEHHGSNVRGLCHFDERVIEMGYGQKPRERMETFFHEILHVFEYEYGLKIARPGRAHSVNNPRDLVYALEGPIASFFLENAWIQWAQWGDLSLHNDDLDERIGVALNAPRAIESGKPTEAAMQRRQVLDDEGTFTPGAGIDVEKPKPKREPKLPPASAIRPGHYRRGTIQPWDFIHDQGMGFFEGNAVKYLCRWRDKGGIQDLEKAKTYIEKFIALEKGEITMAEAMRGEEDEHSEPPQSVIPKIVTGHTRSAKEPRSAFRVKTPAETERFKKPMTEAEKIQEMRAMKKRGEGVTAIGRHFGISRWAVQRLLAK